MSASTVAVTASPAINNNTSLTLDSNSKPNARRRTVAVTEKKSNTEMLLEGGINGVIDDKVVANGKDLSHTMRGESLLERSKDLPQLKKGLIASTISPRRRKAISKPEKPKWQTVLSILMKICLLLMVFFWLGQMIWKWPDRSGDKTNYPFAALDYEGRISEIEASLKRTARMLQVQLEVVDKKIGSEIGIVRTELTKQVEEKGAMFDEELKKLEARTDGLGMSLGEMKDSGLFLKEELEGFMNELKKSRNFDSSVKDLSLDDARAFAREIVEKEIEKHAADGLGRIDYALASGGARVVRHSEPYGSGKSSSWFAVAKGRNGVHASAQKMLEPSFGEPGQCFPLQGSNGFVEVRLRTGIIPEAVTLEHVAKSVGYDMSSSPKDCRVSAWFEGPDDDPSNRAEKMYLLSEFAYDLEKSNAQSFNVETADSRVVNMVRLDFTSNHGSSSLTCIYRLRVHGYEPNFFTAMDMEA